VDALGEVPSRWKDLIMAAGGKGFLAFARSQPDTPGKLAAHAYAYEHLEIAAYELLARVARQAGDSETEELAERILLDERLLAERLDAAFDSTVRSSLTAVGSTGANEQVPAYLSDAHALEQQSIGLLRRAIDASTAPELADDYRAHLED
jgi:ferritin-like metal-binding protein YciE